MNNKALISIGIAGIVIALLCHILVDHAVEDFKTRSIYVHPDIPEGYGTTKNVGTAVGVIGAALLVAGLVRKK